MKLYWVRILTVYISRTHEEAFRCIEREVLREKRIIIKINMVSPHILLCMTPPDAVEALLDYLRNDLEYNGEIVIAEGSAGDTWLGFRRGGFDKIARRYDAELYNIHEDSYYLVDIFDREFNSFKIPISKLLTDNMVISICRVKTHDTVIVTLSIKNVAVGGIVGVDNRPLIHQGYKAINLNIAILAAMMYPRVAIVDGRACMEGNGPVYGSEKEWGFIFSGLNPLEVDAVVVCGMTLDPRDVGYIYYLEKLGFGNLKEVATEGCTMDVISTKFKMHDLFREQLKWRLDKEEERVVLEKIREILRRHGKHIVIPSSLA